MNADEIKLSLAETLDGEQWAREFIERVKDGTLDPANLDHVRPWFQNAIMTGMDRAMPASGDGIARKLKQERNLQ